MKIPQRHRQHYFHSRTHRRLSLNNFMALNQPDEQLLGPLVSFGQTAGRCLDRWRTSERYEVSLQRTTSPASVPKPARCEFSRPNTQFSPHVNPLFCSETCDKWTCSVRPYGHASVFLEVVYPDKDFRGKNRNTDKDEFLF